jgi:hypothetical protein
MKHSLVLLASLLAVSGSGLAESTAKEPPAATQKKPPKKRASAADAKPKAEEGATPGGLPQSFVIPSNTCEQGTPLQKLLTDKPRESK